MSAAARLHAADPDRAPGRPRSCARTGRRWCRGSHGSARARPGPHGAAVVVHPWESGMDNSPSWDEPLAATPEVSHRHLDRRDVRTVSAAQRPTTAEYRHYLGIVAALRDAGWDTEHQMRDSPFAVEDPGFTAIAVRAADDLAVIAPELGEDAAPLRALRRSRCALGSKRCGTVSLERLSRLRPPHRAGGRPADIGRRGRGVGRVRRAACALDRATQVERWMREVPTAWRRPTRRRTRSTPIRYWRGPVWVLVNWMVADGLPARARRPRGARRRCARHARARRPRGLLRILRPPRRYRHRRRRILVDGGAHARLARP